MFEVRIESRNGPRIKHGIKSRVKHRLNPMISPRIEPRIKQSIESRIGRIPIIDQKLITHLQTIWISKLLIHPHESHQE